MATKDIINGKIIEDLMSSEDFKGDVSAYNGNMPSEVHEGLKQLQIDFKKKYKGAVSLKRLIPYILQVGLDNHKLLN